MSEKSWLMVIAIGVWAIVFGLAYAANQAQQAVANAQKNPIFSLLGSL